jgi:hypothetical protein
LSNINDISDLLSVSGNSRRGMKILTFGPTGSGKSPLLASFPRPLAVIDCGEGGIQPYLRPPIIVDGKAKPSLERVLAGEEDLCFTVKGPEEMDRAVEWVLEHEDKFNSLVIDGYNLNWEDHMEYWNERLGGDIQGGQWRIVKGGWKARQKRLMRSQMNIGMSCWLRDIIYEQTQGRPGTKAKLNIQSQEVANIEKSVPYTVDIVLQMKVVTDKQNRPTPNHEIIVAKARRPRTVSPEMLHVGKVTKWRSDRTEDLWALAIAPYVDDWKGGEIVDYLGMDAQEAVREEREMNASAEDAEAGHLIRAMHDAFDAKEFKDMKGFGEFWQRAIAPTINSLSKGSQRLVLEAKDSIKTKIEGDSK